MKAFFIITFFAAVLLVAKSTDLLASSENCTSKTCCNSESKCVSDKKVQLEMAVPQSDPFTILIPGNHF